MVLNESGVLEAIPDAVVVADEQGCVRLYNPAAERMFGYPPSEIVGRDVARLFSCTQAEQPAAEWRDYMVPTDAEGRLRALEVQVRRANGEIFPAWLSVGIAQAGGRPRYVASFRELCAQKAAVARLWPRETRLADLMRVATAGEVAAGMAHEINQPLSALAIYAQAAKRLIRSRPPDLLLLEDVCEKIDAQARRAGDVVQSIRRLIRRPRPHVALLDINSAVADVMDLIEAEAGMEGVPVKAEYTRPLPHVRGDAAQLQAVLLSLVHNSIEAMRNGPTASPHILIRTLRDARGRVCVSVIDRGPGVAAALEDRIFEPFVTSDPERLGIGLSISHSTMKAHDGGLCYEDHPDGGSVFTIHLPPCDQGAAQ